MWIPGFDPLGRCGYQGLPQGGGVVYLWSLVCLVYLSVVQPSATSDLSLSVYPQLIADLRRRLRLPPPAEQSGASQAEPSQPGQHSASHEMALLQNVRFAFQVDKRQHTSWLKVRPAGRPPAAGLRPAGSVVVTGSSRNKVASYRVTPRLGPVSRLLRLSVFYPCCCCCFDEGPAC